MGRIFGVSPPIVLLLLATVIGLACAVVLVRPDLFGIHAENDQIILENMGSKPLQIVSLKVADETIVLQRDLAPRPPRAADAAAGAHRHGPFNYPSFLTVARGKGTTVAVELVTRDPESGIEAVRRAGFILVPRAYQCTWVLEVYDDDVVPSTCRAPTSN